MDDQSATIAFLSDPESHGRPLSRVEKIETHISIVFLVGERAYKLKRAVRFPYLDYSTVSLRERHCKTELVLNRRTAAALYLGVRAITREKDGSIAFDGPGTVVDWVLEMKRFPQDQLFDRLAEEGKLTTGLLRDLTDIVVEFHAAAETTTRYGGSTGLQTVIAGNTANTIASCPPLDRPQVEKLRDGSMVALARVSDILDSRRKLGRVRRCHGDLHLRNVCLYEGRPTLFDCIEFSDEMSSIDVLYDVSFLLMDLVHRGLAGLANTVFNRYFDLTGDIGGLPALALFMSVRAAVRAHVLAAQSRQKPAADANRAAQSYLELAVSLLQPHPPRLIAVGGLSGTGKSTLAAALAPKMMPAPGARIIRSDVLRKRLFGVTPETRLPASAYGPDTTERVYDALQEQAAAALRAGYTAIVDAAFLRKVERDRIAAAAVAAGVPFIGLWLEAPGDILAARIAARTGDASDADIQVLRQQLEFETGTIDWNRIDANSNLTASIARAQTLIG